MRGLQLFFIFIFAFIALPVCAATTNESDTIKHLYQQANPVNIWQNLTDLTSKFPDRYAYHQTGVAAGEWIQSTLENYIEESGRHDVDIRLVKTKGLDNRHDNQPYDVPQSSIVMKIGKSNEPGIVIGAHYDTLGCQQDGCQNETTLPGADDDASGSSILLELAHQLIYEQMSFKKPVYLIWYAAEEEGHWGSQAVVRDFMDRHIPVDIIMQLDQMAYPVNNEKTLYLESDLYLKPGQHSHIDHDATVEFQKLAEKLTGREVKYSCGGSSDNESWVDIAHVRAIRPLESDYCINGSRNNPNVHSSSDRIETLTLEHMLDNLRLAILFTVHYAR